MNYKEVIALVNKRYVLVKQGKEDYMIYDKLQGAILYINDPIVNYKELTKELKRRSSRIFNDVSELPNPSQEPLDWTKKEDGNKNIIIRKMFNQNGIMIGVIVSYSTSKTIKNIKEKELIENRIVDYIHDNIFKDESISTYVEIYRDIASVIAINNIDELQFEYRYLKF